MGSGERTPESSGSNEVTAQLNAADDEFYR